MKIFIKRLLKKFFPSQEMREYHKMHCNHRKELVKLAKETHEYDWEWLHEMIIMQIRHMHEYYSAGNNVYQVDESRLKIVEELKQALDIQEEIKFAEMDADFKSIYKELELYEKLYSFIGKNIRNWWD